MCYGQEYCLSTEYLPNLPLPHGKGALILPLSAETSIASHSCPGLPRMHLADSERKSGAASKDYSRLLVIA